MSVTAEPTLRFEVFGHPAPQGSMKGYVVNGRARLTSDNARLKPWRETVAWAARAAVPFDWTPLQGPVALEVEFWLPRPVSAPKTIDVRPLTKPDVDKLIRAIGDACTEAGIWADDARVVSECAEKFYVVGPHLPKIYDPTHHRTTPGAVITVTRLD